MNKGRKRFHSRFFYASSLFCLSLSAKVKEEEEVKESRVSNPDQKKLFLSLFFSRKARGGGGRQISSDHEMTRARSLRPSLPREA